jgi:hypothetical protein
MFNLENAIEEWRRQMAAGGVTTPDVLEELENHLREDFAEQTQSHCQVQPEQAFEKAARRIGEPNMLLTEFQKFAKPCDEKAARYFFGLRLATIQNNHQYMNTSPASPTLESSWATYTKGAAFLVPAVCLWAFSAVFLFPKVQQICRDAGLAVPALFRIMMAMMGILREHGMLLLAALILSIALLEWRAGMWPRYRRTSVGVAVFLVNSALMLLIVGMFTLALMAAPALFHAK